ncbi:MAG TPA: class II aldolase/adducin family protein, partial [Kofleriaceae bacterium]|nr:class II aldolase/adducin family protein [Kofleriaceae bacterium]
MRLLRAAVAETSRHLHAAGWVANHDGNVTARDGSRFIATPTATSKRLIQDKDLIEVDTKGAVIGRGKVFGEIGLHLAVYERRPDIGAVVHAHPPFATAIASSRGNPIETPFIAEAVVSLGPNIPKLPYAQPGNAAKEVLAPWCELVDVVLLGNHGVLAWGK